MGVKAEKVFSAGHVYVSNLEHPLHGLSQHKIICEASSLIARNMRKLSLALRHTKCGEPLNLRKEAKFFSREQGKRRSSVSMKR